MKITGCCIIMLSLAVTLFAQTGVTGEITVKKQLIDSLAENNEEKFDELYPEVMDFFRQNKAWEEYFDTFRAKIIGLHQHGRHEEAISHAEEMYALAKEIDNNFGRGMATLTMGNIYETNVNYEQALTCYKQAVAYFNQTNYLKYRLRSRFHYAFVLQNLQKFDEALAVLAESQKILDDDKRQHPEETSYHSQYDIDACYTKTYIKIPDLDKAAQHFDRINSYINQLPDRKINYLFDALYFYYRSGNNAKTYALADTLHRVGVENDYKLPVAFSLLYKALAGAKLAGADDVAGLIEEFNNASNALTEEETSQRLDELRTQYDVDMLQLKHRRQQQIIFLALGACVLLLCVIAIIYYYHQKIKRKNRALVRQIQENTGIETRLIASLKTETPETSETPREKLLAEIRKRLHEDKIYHDSALTRESFAALLTTNKNMVSDIFQENVAMSFSEYINELRLRESIVFLKESDLTVEKIAEKVGFGSVRTFQRQFFIKYQMTPKEYRSAALEN